MQQRPCTTKCTIRCTAKQKDGLARSSRTHRTMLRTNGNNTFAFDYSGREFDDEDAKDSEKWRNPGDGRAVSPDDMLTFWDPPTASKDSVHGLYGSAQRMVFRDGLLEEREIGVWVIREKIGKLAVTVSHQGKPIAGSDVKVGGQVVVTNGSGVAVVDLPEGAYTVEAGVLMNGLFFEGRAPAQVTDRGNTSVTVEAQTILRSSTVSSSSVAISKIKDEEGWFEDQTRFSPTTFPSRFPPTRASE